MTEQARKPIRPYVRLGLVGLGLCAVALSLNLRQNLPAWLGDMFFWQIVSGIALSLLLGYQYALLIARRFGRALDVQFHGHWHRYAGIAMIFLFALHAIRFGYAWTSSLSLVFLLAAASGLMNRETMRYRSKPLYLLWFGLHVGLSAALLPLALLHIWVALAFK